jgi:Domain of unknown function (DUF4126)
MTGHLSAPELLGIAASLSLLAGWRLYATVFFLGISQKLHLFHLPEQLHALNTLANPWVLGVAGLGFVAEFFADKIPWLDSAWDTLHTAIRPIGGALLAMSVINPNDTTWQIVALLAGGGAALLSHGAKAGTRAAINTSPEPVSNIVMSTTEDVATAGGLWLTFAHPLVALAIAAVLILLFGYIVWRFIRFFRKKQVEASEAG